MAINPIGVKVEGNKNNNNNNSAAKQVSFCGFNPVLMLMDGIDKGGFAATFIVQDFLGMAAPRTLTGLTRNSNETGEKNTGYARLVAIREILSGPSTFIIPGIMIYAIKKSFGRANDVPVNFIKGLNDHFEDFAQKHTDILSDSKKLKAAYYEHAVNHMLYSSTTSSERNIKGEYEHYLVGEELKSETQKLTKLLVEIDEAPKKYFWNYGKTNKNGQKYAETLKGEFIEHFVELRKSHSDNPSNKIHKIWFNIKNNIPNVKEKSLNATIGEFVNHLMNYTDDVTNTISKKFKPDGSIKKFVEDFGYQRVASRFLANTAMTAAVIAFFTIIPKLYNSKDGKNPALAGLDTNEQYPKKKAEGK